MRRREFIGVMAGSCVPAMARQAKAQRKGAGRPRVGVLLGYLESDKETEARLRSLKEQLTALGWRDGENVQIDYRFPGLDIERTRAAATDLLAKAPDVVFVSPAQTLLVARPLLVDTPVVFANLPDPVALGLVISLAAPGGNMTGFTNFERDLAGKWLQLLKEVAPKTERALVLYDPENPAWRQRMPVIEASSRHLGVGIASAAVSSASEIASAIGGFASRENGGLITFPGPFMTNHRSAIVEQARRARLPDIYPFSVFVRSGGLISYGIDSSLQFRQAATYVDRILRGERPSDLPVQAPTKFELVLNLKTAKSLGLEMPATLLAIADEVIE